MSVAYDFSDASASDPDDAADRPVDVNRLERAQHMASLGFAVFPCHWRTARGCSCGNRVCENAAKHPFGRLAKNGRNSAVTDAKEVERIWRDAHAANIGACTDNIVALDVDPRHGGDETLKALEAEYGPLPRTWRSLTGGGGEHIFFRQPEGEKIRNSSGSIGPGIDVRGVGGYILAPGSVHISGRTYEWNVDYHPDETAVGDMPPWLLAKALKKPEGNADSAEPSFDFNSDKAAHSIEALIQKARAPGHWHESMVLATSHLIGRGTPPAVVIDLLAPRVTMPGYHEMRTRSELRVMVEGAERKGYGAKPRENEMPFEGDDAGSPFLTISQLSKLPAREFRIKDYLYTDGASMIFAPPGRFKSFLALDMYLSIAYGVPWHGFEVKQGKVLYVCAEGRGGFFKRIRPWQEARAGGRDTDQFLILPQPVNLMIPANVDKLIDAIGHHLNGVSCVAFDTVARSFGSGDENSTQDMNAYVAGFDKLVQAGAHVTHIHHSGKDLSKGGRGSSAFNAALDTIIEITREPGDEIATILCRKMKDDEEPKPLKLRFSKSEGVHPDTGEVLTSLVPTLAGDDEKTPAAKLTKQQEAVLKLIRDGVGSRVVIASALKVDPDNLKRPLKVLKDCGLIFQDEAHFWQPAAQNDLSRTSQKDAEDQEDE